MSIKNHFFLDSEGADVHKHSPGPDTSESDDPQEDFTLIRWTSRHRKFIKTVSLLLAGLFLHQQLGWTQAGQPVWSAPRTQAPHTPESPSFDFEVPRHLAETQSRDVTSSDRTIINIQDAHASLSAQYSISELLDSLVSQYDMDMIALEGGSGYIDTSFLRSFPDEGFRQTAAEHLLSEGKLSAGEFFSITSDHSNISVFGIEDDKLYQQNLESFREVAEERSERIAHVDALLKQLDAIAHEAWPKELYAFEKESASHREGSLSFNNYLNVLKEYSSGGGLELSEFGELRNLIASMELEEKIDFSAANTERRQLIEDLSEELKDDAERLKSLVLKSVSFKEKEITEAEFYTYLIAKARENELDLTEYSNLDMFTEYVELYEKIDIFLLYLQLEKLEDRIREGLYGDEREKEIYDVVNMVRLIRRLYAMELDNGKYAYIKNNYRKLDAAYCSEIIREEALSNGIPMQGGYELDQVFGGIQSALRFYEGAESREDAILANTLKRMEENQTRVAALVTGGYHSEGLSELMRAQGLSYFVVMPKFEAGQERPYVAVLTNRENDYREELDVDKYKIAAPIYFSHGRVGTAQGLAGIVEELLVNSKLVEALEKLAEDRDADFAGVWEENLVNQLSKRSSLTEEEAREFFKGLKLKRLPDGTVLLLMDEKAFKLANGRATEIDPQKASSMVDREEQEFTVDRRGLSLEERTFLKEGNILEKLQDPQIREHIADEFVSRQLEPTENNIRAFLSLLGIDIAGETPKKEKPFKDMIVRAAERVKNIFRRRNITVPTKDGKRIEIEREEFDLFRSNIEQQVRLERFPSAFSSRISEFKTAVKKASAKMRSMESERDRSALQENLKRTLEKEIGGELADFREIEFLSEADLQKRKQILEKAARELEEAKNAFFQAIVRQGIRMLLEESEARAFPGTDIEDSVVRVADRGFNEWTDAEKYARFQEILQGYAQTAEGKGKFEGRELFGEEALRMSEKMDLLSNNVQPYRAALEMAEIDPSTLSTQEAREGKIASDVLLEVLSWDEARARAAKDQVEYGKSLLSIRTGFDEAERLFGEMQRAGFADRQVQDPATEEPMTFDQDRDSLIQLEKNLTHKLAEFRKALDAFELDPERKSELLAVIQEKELQLQVLRHHKIGWIDQIGGVQRIGRIEGAGNRLRSVRERVERIEEERADLIAEQGRVEQELENVSKDLLSVLGVISEKLDELDEIQKKLHHYKEQIENNLPVNAVELDEFIRSLTETPKILVAVNKKLEKKGSDVTFKSLLNNYNEQVKRLSDKQNALRAYEIREENIVTSADMFYKSVTEEVKKDTEGITAYVERYEREQKQLEAAEEKIENVISSRKWYKRWLNFFTRRKLQRIRRRLSGLREKIAVLNRRKMDILFKNVEQNMVLFANDEFKKNPFLKDVSGINALVEGGIPVLEGKAIQLIEEGMERQLTAQEKAALKEKLSKSLESLFVEQEERITQQLGLFLGHVPGREERFGFLSDFFELTVKDVQDLDEETRSEIKADLSEIETDLREISFLDFKIEWMRYKNNKGLENDLESLKERRTELFASVQSGQQKMLRALNFEDQQGIRALREMTAGMRNAANLMLMGLVATTAIGALSGCVTTGGMFEQMSYSDMDIPLEQPAASAEPEEEETGLPQIRPDQERAPPIVQPVTEEVAVDAEEQAREEIVDLIRQIDGQLSELEINEVLENRTAEQLQRILSEARESGAISDDILIDFTLDLREEIAAAMMESDPGLDLARVRFELDNVFSEDGMDGLREVHSAILEGVSPKEALPALSRDTALGTAEITMLQNQIILNILGMEDFEILTSDLRETLGSNINELRRIRTELNDGLPLEDVLPALVVVELAPLEVSPELEEVEVPVAPTPILQPSDLDEEVPLEPFIGEGPFPTGLTPALVQEMMNERIVELERRGFLFLSTPDYASIPRYLFRDQSNNVLTDISSVLNEAVSYKDGLTGKVHPVSDLQHEQQIREQEKEEILAQEKREVLRDSWRAHQEQEGLSGTGLLLESLARVTPDIAEPPLPMAELVTPSERFSSSSFASAFDPQGAGGGIFNDAIVMERRGTPNFLLEGGLELLIESGDWFFTKSVPERGQPARQLTFDEINQRLESGLKVFAVQKSSGEEFTLSTPYAVKLAPAFEIWVEEEGRRLYLRTKEEAQEALDKGLDVKVFDNRGAGRAREINIEEIDLGRIFGYLDQEARPEARPVNFQIYHTELDYRYAVAQGYKEMGNVRKTVELLQGMRKQLLEKQADAGLDEIEARSFDKISQELADMQVSAAVTLADVLGVSRDVAPMLMPMIDARLDLFVYVMEMVGRRGDDQSFQAMLREMESASARGAATRTDLPMGVDFGLSPFVRYNEVTIGQFKTYRSNYFGLSLTAAERPIRLSEGERDEARDRFIPQLDLWFDWEAFGVSVPEGEPGTAEQEMFNQAAAEVTESLRERFLDHEVDRTARFLTLEFADELGNFSIHVTLPLSGIGHPIISFDFQPHMPVGHMGVISHVDHAGRDERTSHPISIERDPAILEEVLSLGRQTLMLVLRGDVFPYSGQIGSLAENFRNLHRQGEYLDIHQELPEVRDGFIIELDAETDQVAGRDGYRLTPLLTEEIRRNVAFFLDWERQLGEIGQRKLEEEISVPVFFDTVSERQLEKVLEREGEDISDEAKQKIAIQVFGRELYDNELRSYSEINTSSEFRCALFMHDAFQGGEHAPSYTAHIDGKEYKVLQMTTWDARHSRTLFDRAMVAVDESEMRVAIPLFNATGFPVGQLVERYDGRGRFVGFEMFDHEENAFKMDYDPDKHREIGRSYYSRTEEGAIEYHYEGRDLTGMDLLQFDSIGLSSMRIHKKEYVVVDDALKHETTLVTFHGIGREGDIGRYLGGYEIEIGPEGEHDLIRKLDGNEDLIREQEGSLRVLPIDEISSEILEEEPVRIDEFVEISPVGEPAVEARRLPAERTLVFGAMKIELPAGTLVQERFEDGRVVSIEYISEGRLVARAEAPEAEVQVQGDPFRGLLTIEEAATIEKPVESFSVTQARLVDGTSREASRADEFEVYDLDGNLVEKKYDVFSVDGEVVVAYLVDGEEVQIWLAEEGTTQIGQGVVTVIPEENNISFEGYLTEIRRPITGPVSIEGTEIGLSTEELPEGSLLHEIYDDSGKLASLEYFSPVDPRTAERKLLLGVDLVGGIATDILIYDHDDLGRLIHELGYKIDAGTKEAVLAEDKEFVYKEDYVRVEKVIDNLRKKVFVYDTEAPLTEEQLADSEPGEYEQGWLKEIVPYDGEQVYWPELHSELAARHGGVSRRVFV